MLLEESNTISLQHIHHQVCSDSYYPLCTPPLRVSPPPCLSGINIEEGRATVRSRAWSALYCRPLGGRALYSVRGGRLMRSRARQCNQRVIQMGRASSFTLIWWAKRKDIRCYDGRCTNLIFATTGGSVLFSSWCVFSIENATFLPIFAILSRIYALFGVPLKA